MGEPHVEEFKKDDLKERFYHRNLSPGGEVILQGGRKHPIL